MKHDDSVYVNLEGKWHKNMACAGGEANGWDRAELKAREVIESPEKPCGNCVTDGDLEELKKSIEEAMGQ